MITKFKDFLRESEEEDFQISPGDKEDLEELFAGLEADEIDSIGSILYTYFYTEGDEDPEDLDDEIDSEDYEFEEEDLWGIVNSVGQDAIEAIWIILSSELEEPEDLFAELDELLYSDELDESGVSRRMKTTDMNRSRKYMDMTRAKLRATRALRKAANRKNHQKNKQYRRRNKRKMKAYQASRKKAIELGKHQVKRRR